MDGVRMDPQFVEKIVHEVKSQGVFDEFRKDSMADVDTKPAYQNLRQRVDSAVMQFLSEQEWRPDMNKNQLRERLRRHITESGFLDVGVERIVDQVVNPKIGSVFQPRIEEIAYKYLGIPQPPSQANCEPPTIMGQFPPLPLHDPTDLQVEIGGGLLADLEQVSPDSDMATVRSESKSEHQDMDMDIDMDVDKPDEDDESPPFEPLVNSTPPITQQLELSTKEMKLTSENDADKQQPPEDKKIVLVGGQNDTQETVLSENSRQVDLPDSEKESSRFAVSQETQMSQVSSESHISSLSQSEFNANSERTLRTQVHELESPAVNISEEAQMPKFNENSSDGNVTAAIGENQNSTHHFDIKKDEIKFEGTARKTCHLAPPMGNTKDSFDGEQPNGSDYNQQATGTASPVPYTEQSTIHTPTPPAAVTTGPESTFESSMDENVLTSDAVETPQPPSIREDNANSTAVTAERADFTLKPPAVSPPPPPPTPSRDKDDKCSSSQHSSSSSSSRHKKHDKDKDKDKEKDKHRSRDRSDRSKSSHDRSSSTKSRHSSSSSKHSSTHSSKPADSHGRSESSRSHHSSSRSNSKRDRERDRERGRDSERSRSDRDKKHHSSSSSSSSRKTKSDAQKTDDSKKAKVNDGTKETQSEVDDHNESKENVYRRKSNDSNDGGEKEALPGKAGGLNGSTTAQSDGNSEKREKSQSGEAESKDGQKKSNETSSKSTEQDKTRDEPQQQQHKVVILNDILENPDTHFINLAANATVDHMEIVRSVAKNCELTHTKDRIDPDENTKTQSAATDDDKVEQEEQKDVATIGEKCQVNEEANAVKTTKDQCQVKEDASEDKHEECVNAVGPSGLDGDDDSRLEDDELLYFEGSSKPLCERIRLLESVIDFSNFGEKNVNFGAVMHASTTEVRGDVVDAKNRPLASQSNMSVDTPTDMEHDRRLPHTPPKRRKDSDRDRQQLQKPSPTPSDTSSINSKENDMLERNVPMSGAAGKSKELEKRTKLTRQQRYSSEDLYKPRPVLGQRSRRRGLDATLDAATKLFGE